MTTSCIEKLNKSIVTHMTGLRTENSQLRQEVFELRKTKAECDCMKAKRLPKEIEPNSNE